MDLASEIRGGFAKFESAAAARPHAVCSDRKNVGIFFRYPRRFAGARRSEARFYSASGKLIHDLIEEIEVVNAVFGFKLYP